MQPNLDRAIRLQSWWEYNVSPLSDVELRNNITYICALGFEKKSGVKAIIDKLSAEYWKHKGYYNFTSTYKGSF